jgi:hypothetical protein
VRDKNTLFRRALDALNFLRGDRPTKGDKWEIVWAESKERASFGDKTDKGGPIVWVITLTWSSGNDILETKTGLEKDEWRSTSGRFDHIKDGHTVPGILAPEQISVA